MAENRVFSPVTFLAKNERKIQGTSFKKHFVDRDTSLSNERVAGTLELLKTVKVKLPEGC